MGLTWSSPAPAQSAIAQSDDRAVIDCLRQADPQRLDRLREAARARLGLPAVLPPGTPAQTTPPADGGGDAEAAPVAVRLGDYDFPFENLVFEGGGGKGRIYGGALKCLRDAGVKAKRFAGSSAGAITAALLAVNATPEEVDEIMSNDLEKILLGKSWKRYLSVLPSFFKNYGMYDASGFLAFLGDVLKKKTGDADITFEGVLKKYGNELCVTAVNVNLMSVVYFHPKTTPSLPVRVAVRMSMSIPGLFTPVEYSFTPDFADYYVDGGVLCNYPIHVFDGWWLSMKPDDRFYRKLPSLTSMPKLLDRSERFGAVNKRSLGFLVYSSDEEDIMQVDLDKRIENLRVLRPDTALYRKRQASLEVQSDGVVAHTIRVGSSDRFVEALLGATHKKGDEDYVARSDFKRIFSDLKPKADSSGESLTAADARILFGEACDADKLFDLVDPKHEGEVPVYDVFFALEKELDLHTRFLGHGRKDVKDMKEYWFTLLNTLELNAGKMYIQGTDLERTVGLCTDYIGTLDFNVDPADQRFLNEQGYRITELFLRDYVAKNKLQPRSVAI